MNENGYIPGIIGDEFKFVDELLPSLSPTLDTEENGTGRAGKILLRNSVVWMTR
jgi:hypothetical protein